MNSNIDLSYLTEVTGGDESVIKEMLQIISKEIPGQIELIKENIRMEDWSSVASEAHKVKPSFLYIGKPELNELAVLIEQNARKREQLDLMSGHIQKLEEGYNLISDQLQQMSAD